MVRINCIQDSSSTSKVSATSNHSPLLLFDPPKHGVLLMRAGCLPISAIPHVSRLFQDYLSHFDRVSSFYPRPPFSNFYATEAASLKYPAERRQRVADVLEKQNRGWGASAKTLQNVG